MSVLAEVLARSAGTGGSGSGGSKSPVALLVAGLFFVVVAGTQAVNPRLLWRANRWAYKNPEANEPSDKGFMVQRMVGALVAVVGVVLVITALTKL